MRILLIVVTATAFLSGTCFGSGVDCSQFPGGDAAAKISACIASLPATGGIADATAILGAQTLSSNFLSGVSKPVTLLTGYATYTVDTTITYPSLFRWIAAGTVLTQNFAGYLLESDQTVGSDDTEFSGLTLNGNAASIHYSLLQHTGKRGYFHRNTFTDSGPQGANTTVGLRIQGSASVAADLNNVADNRFLNTRWISVSIATNANHNIVSHNFFQNCFAPLDINGDAEDSEGNEFSTNEIDGCQANSFIQSVTNTTVSGNHFYNAPGPNSGAYLTILLASGSASRRTVITGNQFYGSGNMGPCVLIQNNVSYFLITDNLIHMCGQDGIYLQVTGGANSGRGIIGHNYFLDSGVQSPSAGFNAIELQADSTSSIIDMHISGNSTFDDQTTQSQAWGLRTESTGTYRDFTVVDNDFANNKTGGISWGSGTVPAHSVVANNKVTE